MKQSPISNPFDDEEAYTRNFRLAILGFGLFICLGITALGFMRNQTEFISLYEQYFPSPTVTPTPAPTLTATRTSTPTATYTPTLNLTATQSAFISTNTAMAFRSTTTALAEQWQEILSEPFDNNNNNWYLAAQEDDEYSKSTFEIKDGKYRLSVLSHKGFIRWVPVSTNTLEDFSLTIEAKMVENSDANDYGIAFRVDGEGNFYYFAINSDHLYSLYKFQGTEWTTLIDPTETPLIKKDGPNRLTVLAQGTHFILLINDQFVADEDDDSIKKGTTALAFEIYQPDQQATFEFDNIVLRTP
jgi:Domain of Unknown Function (DUF1080).